MTENEISYHIRGAIYAVYNELGPGLLESIYEAALIAELEEKGLKIECQKKIDVYYHGKKLPVDYRIDILVDDKVIIELKSVQDMREVYFLQIKSYLKLTSKRLGILVNFNCEDINENIWRIANKL